MTEDDSINAMLRAEIRALHDALLALLRETTILREERNAMVRAIRPARRSTARKKPMAH